MQRREEPRPRVEKGEQAASVVVITARIHHPGLDGAQGVGGRGWEGGGGVGGRGGVVERKR